MKTLSPQFKVSDDFLADVLTTAIESPVGEHWLAWQVQEEDSERRVKLALLKYENHVEGPATKKTTVSLTTIADGILRIIESSPPMVNAELTGYILNGLRHDDAGMIDADCADVILQAAVYNAVVFG